jgi:hypothetical protein
MKIDFNLEKQKLATNIPNINVFDKNINFYICSSGGCGSTIIYNYLSNFGNVYHIHDRFPPDELSYIGNENTDNPVYNEWFNSTKIPENKLQSYKVIFLYRNPINVIFSRFAHSKGPNQEHLKHIKCINDGNIWFGDVVKYKKDFYGLEEFFDNYTIPKKRNYSIYCVKYEHFFENISLFNKTLGIPDIKFFYPIKKERLKRITYVKELSIIYNSLIKKMNSMPYIKIIPKLISDESNESNESNDV